MKGDTGRKFLVLQWKSLLQKRRHYILTALEIIIPTLLFLVMVIFQVTEGSGWTPELIVRKQSTTALESRQRTKCLHL
jgi:hypothetical protein